MIKEKTLAKSANAGLKIILLGSYLAFLLFLMIMPPYFVMDRASGGRSHAPVGHHFFWNPPGIMELGPELCKKFPEEFSIGTEEWDANRYTVSVNRIRLAFFSIFGTGVYLVARCFLQKKYMPNENKSRYP